jgi:hypothetical protein
MILQIVLSRPVPFIYERLGEIQPYLIDEFRIRRICNLLLPPLIENALAVSQSTVGGAKHLPWRGGKWN